MFMFMAFLNRTQLPMYVKGNLKLMDTIWCEKIENMGSMLVSSVSFVLILNIRAEGTLKLQDWRSFGSKFCRKIETYPSVFFI